MLFETTEEQKANIKNIIDKMIEEGLESFFIEIVASLAMYDQGVYDLTEMWSEEVLEEVKEEIINDIKESIRDYIYGGKAADFW